MASNYDFYNNYGSTLGAILTIAATSATVVSTGSLATPASGRTLLLTLISASDDTVFEIIKVTTVTGPTSLPVIVRAQEGSTAREWPAGTLIQARLTAGMAADLLAAGFKLDHTNSALGTSALDLQTYRASAGRAATGARATAAGYDNSATGADSTAVGSGNTASGANSVAVGKGNTASAAEAVAIGEGATASGSGAIAIGDSAVASGARSVAIGDGAVVSVDGSIAIDTTGVVAANKEVTGHSTVVFGTGYFPPGRAINRNVSIGATNQKYLPFIGAAHYFGLDFINEHGWWFAGSADLTETLLQTTRKTTFYSIPIQLGDAARPGASTAVKHGYSFVSGGYVYTAYCFGTYYTSGTTSGSPPALTTTPGATTTDGTVEWICVGATAGFSLEMLLGSYARFTPTKVGVMAKWSTPGGAATYPQLTFGVNGSLASWLAATTHSKLTGDYSNHMTDPTATVGAKQFGAAVSTFGTDLDCVAVIVWEGYIRESDVT